MQPEDYVRAIQECTVSIQQSGLCALPPSAKPDPLAHIGLNQISVVLTPLWPLVARAGAAGRFYI